MVRHVKIRYVYGLKYYYYSDGMGVHFIVSGVGVTMRAVDTTAVLY